MARHIHIHVNDVFEESKHKRAANGQFGSGGGTSAKGPARLLNPGVAKTMNSGQAKLSGADPTGVQAGWQKALKAAENLGTSATIGGVKHTAIGGNEAESIKQAQEAHAKRNSPETHLANVEEHRRGMQNPKTAGGHQHAINLHTQAAKFPSASLSNEAHKATYAAWSGTSGHTLPSAEETAQHNLPAGTTKKGPNFHFPNGTVLAVPGAKQPAPPKGGPKPSKFM